MPAMRPLLLLVVLAGSAGAATTPIAPPAAAAPAAELRPLMLARGEQAFAEPFVPAAWQARWGRQGVGWQAGEWTERDGGIRCAPIPAENHHPALGHRLDLADVVVQFAFRFDDADAVLLGFDDKEHIARLVLHRDAIEIVKMSGIGATTKGETIDRAPAKLEPGRWYTAVIELQGDEMLAQVDERWIVYGQAAGLAATKSRLELMSYGGKAEAGFAHLTVWKPAGFTRDWEKDRKPKLLELMKKRKP
jgi:hypothetical protein